VRRVLEGGYELDDDPRRIDVDAVHDFISRESYWGQGRTRERVQSAIAGSRRVLGLYERDRQIGFARAVSDGTTLAYIADVYVLSPYRGLGLGLELVRTLMDDRDGGLPANVHWMLHTRDAQGLYAKLGFREGPPRYPLMERSPPRR
jgi:ribosomal protein S18 acetylase RimI-like enzyme